jgi:putative flippase GtrA
LEATRGDIERRQRGFVASFSRNAATSLFTTALDIGVLAALVELARTNVVLATWLGTVIGCLSNFAINRRWSFAAHESAAHWQLVRFLPVQIGSSTIQTVGVWMLVSTGGMAYLWSKIAVAIFVYGVWNYPMNRFFVFGPRRLAA